MNYEKSETRKMIYRERTSLEDFHLLDDTTLNAFMFERIQRTMTKYMSESILLNIFNNAYYITTAILMEKFPIIHIYEFNSVAFSAAGVGHAFQGYYAAITMAMVCNNLRILDNKYLKGGKDELLLTKISEYFHMDNAFGPSSSGTENYKIHHFFFDNLLDVLELGKHIMYPSDFEPLNKATAPMNNILSTNNDGDCQQLQAIIDKQKSQIEKLHAENAIIPQLQQKVSELQKQLSEKQMEIETIEIPRQKIRIELLNFLFKKLGCDVAWMTKNRKVSALARVYAAIMGHNNPKALCSDVGRVTYIERPKELDSEIKEINTLLRVINEDWKIEL